MMDNIAKDKLKPAEKFSLTIEEGAEYFEIGVKKLREIYKEHRYDGMFAKNGTKVIIFRPQFERWLIDTPVIP